MPMVSYQSSDSRMHVMMPQEIPQLTPLLASNPGDHFDPADPWFSELDPSGGGASFSRRYGFVMDAMSDPLPPNTQMWIRKLSGSSELKSYRYSSTAPKALAPIFGTDGATNALFWSGMMFHPVFAAPPGTNNPQAAFEVYLLDTVSGLEVPNSSSGPLEFKWTNISDGRPTLSVAHRIVVAWPAGAGTQWVLETAASLEATASWTIVTNAAVLVDGRPSAILESSATPNYFRMRHVP